MTFRSDLHEIALGHLGQSLHISHPEVNMIKKIYRGEPGGHGESHPAIRQDRDPYDTCYCTAQPVLLGVTKGPDRLIWQ